MALCYMTLMTSVTSEVNGVGEIDLLSYKCGKLTVKVN